VISSLYKRICISSQAEHYSDYCFNNSMIKGTNKSEKTQPVKSEIIICTDEEFAFKL